MPEEQRDTFFTELLKFALVAVVIVVPVRLFVAQPFIVSGASMSPTFQNSDYLIVDELSYRLGNPQRGDVIIFQPPGQPKGVYYIKRVIGLPGETVDIANNTVTITTVGGETLTLDEPYVKNIGDGGPYHAVLPQGQYFVLGDNRPESSDSRVWGQLPRQNIVGRAFLRLLPLQQAQLLPGDAHYSH